MQKYTKMADITTILLAFLLIASFTLLSIAQAQEPVTEDICTSWLVEETETPEGITYLINIIETVDTYQPDYDDECEVWFYNSSKSAFGILILIESVEALNQA